MNYADNPLYAKQGEFNGVSVYILSDANNYHLSRYVEAQNQQIFSAQGMTKERMKLLTDEIIRICNDEPVRTVKTDVAGIATLMQYCSKYPLDEQCSIKMGATLSFMDGEEPDTVQPFYINKKIELANTNPDAYAFFLSWGIANIPEYKTTYDTLIDLDYFRNRTEQMRSLLPSQLHHMI